MAARAPDRPGRDPRARGDRPRAVLAGTDRPPIGDLGVLDAATVLMRMVDGVAQRSTPFDPTAWVTAIDAYVDRARAALIPGEAKRAGQPKKTSASA